MQVCNHGNLAKVYWYMRPSQFRENCLYCTEKPDYFQTKHPRLLGFSYQGGWITICPDGGFRHKANRPDFTGFAWDGCSPKFHIGPLMLGTWDGPFDESNKLPKAVRAAKFHDALYQEREALAVIGFSRLHSDLLFKEILEDADFIFPDLYFLAVRLFGWIDVRIFELRDKPDLA